MQRTSLRGLLLLALLVVGACQAPQEQVVRPSGPEEAARTATPSDLRPPENPSVPDDMTLDELLDRAAEMPPIAFPQPIDDSPLRAFAIIEQFESRVNEEATDQLGIEAQGWVGYDYQRLWWKLDGDAGFDGKDAGETELDVLYSRAVAPFWDVQVGAQVAYEWSDDQGDERHSAVLALQGIAPGQFEVDTSLYLADDGDVTAALEAEWNLRLTQRLVLQPRAEIGLAAQDVAARALGAGLTDGAFDLRLRYEWERRFAPYVGVRYLRAFGETADIVALGGDVEQFTLLLGMRLAF